MINYGISYQKIKLGSYLFYRGLESLSSGARNSKGRRRADKREARPGITGQDIVVLLTQGRIKEFNEAREREEALYYVDLMPAILATASLGNIRCETLKAFTIDEAARIIERV